MSEKDMASKLPLAGSGEFSVKSTWRVETFIDEDRGEINQTLSTETGKLMTWINKTRDAQFRQALIALGWTPPPTDSTNPS